MYDIQDTMNVSLLPVISALLVNVNCLKLMVSISLPAISLSMCFNKEDKEPPTLQAVYGTYILTSAYCQMIQS
ncbi:hypothetical protein BCR43DRAFT_494876 [Syncephalastrum racemosum]|uniref:Uncharacterized protein n=1 Tax=Syncephalastrum racemosum TaxID=13706 RepID=A0A1X2H8S3_SYNRA|nr:hypothetical protein BCR43DRAFT_494876 [Syncephalastrum racemosum]